MCSRSYAGDLLVNTYSLKEHLSAPTGDNRKIRLESQAEHIREGHNPNLPLTQFDPPTPDCHDHHEARWEVLGKGSSEFCLGELFIIPINTGIQ